VRQGVMEYDRRHGYRGPEAFITLPQNEKDLDQTIADTLSAHPRSGEYLSAVVTTAQPSRVEAQMLDGDTIVISGQGLRFAASALKSTASKSRQIRPGAVIRVRRVSLNPASNDSSVSDSKSAQSNWEIVQLPQVESALIAMRPQDGAIYALVGGFDFNHSKFNHITQAWRQPGSSFKPFIYSAALDKGIGPATLINDAPFYLSPEQTGGQAWSPKNYDARYQGPVTMRQALEKSINLISIRILAHIGTQYAQTYITQKFGFDPDKTPPYLSMALGTGLVTPLQMASAYSVFANGGYGVNPYLIAEVSDADGVVLSRAKPLVAGKNAPQMLDARNEYIMTSLLQSVAQNGTGSRSRVLNRSDLAGKTGTTNDSRDAWFAGFQPTVTAVAWLGYDQPKSLGDRETGGGLALPIWINYMRHALDGVPMYQWPKPPGIVELKGELYYDLFTPGHGFVDKIDVNPPEPTVQVQIGSHQAQQDSQQSSQQNSTQALPSNEVAVSEEDSAAASRGLATSQPQEEAQGKEKEPSDSEAAPAQAHVAAEPSTPTQAASAASSSSSEEHEVPLPDPNSAR
jgi:penicillin-binding protein 1A